MRTIRGFLLSIFASLFLGMTPGDAQDRVFGGKEVAVIRTTWDVRGMVLSPNGKTVYSVNYGGYIPNDYIYVIDIASQKTAYFLGRGRMWSIGVSPDGKRIASGGMEGVSIYDADTHKEILRIQTKESPNVLSVVFSPDGKRLVSGGGGKRKGIVKVHDIESGKELLDLTGHTGHVTCVAYSADGKWIATGSTDYSVRVWNAETGAEQLAFTKHTCKVNSVTISRDGKWIVSAGGRLRQDDPAWDPKTERDGKGEVKVWDRETGKERYDLTGQEKEVHSVAISSDGKRIAAVGDQMTVSVWNTATGQLVATLRATESLNCLASVIFTHDGNRIITGEEHSRVRVWELSK